MRSINLPFTKDFININSPQLLKTIAISPSTKISVRIEAAQKAFDLNELSSESVAAIYQSVDFTSDELQNPLKTIEMNYTNDPSKAMALLFQSSRIQILPISRLEALNNLWEYSININESKLAFELSKDLPPNPTTLDLITTFDDVLFSYLSAKVLPDNVEVNIPILLSLVPNGLVSAYTSDIKLCCPSCVI